MFKGKKGKVLAAEMGKRAKTFVPGAPVGGSKSATPAAQTGPKKQDVEAIKVNNINAPPQLDLIFFTALQVYLCYSHPFLMFCGLFW